MKTKLFFLLFALVAFASTLYADAVQIGDLYYNLDGNYYTAQVASNPDKYVGEFTIPNFVEYNDVVYRVTGIGDYAFANCKDLTSLIISDSIKSIGKFAFSSCIGITKITIPDYVTSIGESAFYDCENMSTITMGHSVYIIGREAFGSCLSLSSIELLNVVSIGMYAFSSCKNLTNIIIPHSVTNIGAGVFSNCYALTSIVVEDGNSSYDSRDNCNAVIETSTNTLIAGCKNSYIPYGIITIGDNAFSGIGITNIVIPNSVTRIGTYAFYACTLSSLDIPNSVTSIGGAAFEYCTLKSIEIPQGVTSIEGSTFYNCNYLTSVTIPNSVTNIEIGAFSGCTSLNRFTCKASTPPTMGNESFNGVDKSFPLYVPSASISKYQVAEGWKSFTNIQSIPGTESSGTIPAFPGDPGTITYKLQLGAMVIGGDSLPNYTPTGAGGYAVGSEVTITALDITGYEFVQWSDSVTDKSRTIEVNESMTLTALYSRSMIEIPVAANAWTFFCLPPLGDRQYTEEMFTYDGLTEVKWGTYNGATRASGKSGWQTPERFSPMQGYIIYSTTAGTLRINAYENEIADEASASLTDYASPLPENSGWNFLGNPYAQGYNIAGLAAAGIESPITIWNGTGYDTYTPGIDTYILQPFEAFFIQKAEGGAESITFSREYLSNAGSNMIQGELPGAFSVSATDKVHFSQGNLQYQASTNTWRFAENQYDAIGDDNQYISSTYDGWIDLFGWGTSGYNNTANDPFAINYHPWSTSHNELSQTSIVKGTEIESINCEMQAVTGKCDTTWAGGGTYTAKDVNYFGYGPSTFMADKNLTGTSANYDWGVYNAIVNGGNLKDQWRTLTIAEWQYIFNSRPMAQYLRSQATVCGIHGYVLLPDDFTLPDGMSWSHQTNDWETNTYNAQAWGTMEAAGAVFLPAVGYREGNVVYEVGSTARYWSSSYSSHERAGDIYFSSDESDTYGNGNLYAKRHGGRSVRLVR